MIGALATVASTGRMALHATPQVRQVRMWTCPQAPDYAFRFYIDPENPDSIVYRVHTVVADQEYGLERVISVDQIFSKPVAWAEETLVQWLNEYAKHNGQRVLVGVRALQVKHYIPIEL
jgi:hypothetical protein